MMKWGLYLSIGESGRGMMVFIIPFLLSGALEANEGRVFSFCDNESHKHVRLNRTHSIVFCAMYYQPYYQ